MHAQAHTQLYLCINIYIDSLVLLFWLFRSSFYRRQLRQQVKNPSFTKKRPEYAIPVNGL